MYHALSALHARGVLEKGTCGSVHVFAQNLIHVPCAIRFSIRNGVADAKRAIRIHQFHCNILASCVGLPGAVDTRALGVKSTLLGGKG
jgi:hypothetical protein